MRIKFGEWETTTQENSEKVMKKQILYYQKHPEEYLELMGHDLHLYWYQKLWIKFLAKIGRKTMNFASALFSLKRGHKIKRKHWTGWWELDGNEVMMHCHDGRVINIRDSEDITYTIENMACDDWTIADNCGAKRELSNG